MIIPGVIILRISAAIKGPSEKVSEGIREVLTSF
jgi:hypothetical protein